MEDTTKIIDYLNPNERKLIPWLKEKSINDLCKKTNLDKVSVLRSLEFLQNKGIIKLQSEKKKVVEIGVNGAQYKKTGLPERKLLSLLNIKRIVPLSDAQTQSKISKEEFKAAIGALKKKAMINLNKGKIVLEAKKEEVSKKMLEEIFLESLPKEYSELTPEELFALKSMQNRKNIVHIKEKTIVTFEVTELGIKLIKSGIKDEDLIGELDSSILKKQSWKSKKFRKYDVTSPVPQISGGKRHFVNQATDYGRKIWTDMGFEEMSGNMLQSSFWNFDALFTAQDHPVREMQDTFFIDKKVELPSDKKLIAAVKDSHEGKIKGSKGWNYEWDSEEGKNLVLRTHTTCLSSQKLAKLKPNELPKKFFAIGKCFRNETVDWSHGFEFNQTEGIVIDENANFRHLLGYLKQFFSKMGFEKIKFTPAYFPYTEPSVEIHWWHPDKKVWLELGGAGIFRPEMTIPLLGKHIPVLAWGPGFDRILMDYYKIKDLRELYKNDLNQLRKMKYWMKN